MFDYSLSFILYVFSCVYFLLIFFFKQKTAYEMRISDWSSDVCSSDLALHLQPQRFSSDRRACLDALRAARHERAGGLGLNERRQGLFALFPPFMPSAAAGRVSRHAHAGKWNPTDTASRCSIRRRCSPPLSHPTLRTACAPAHPSPA